MTKKRYAAAAALLGLLLNGCAAATAPAVHTLHPGDGTRAPETVIVTLPPETVIVTVPTERTTSPETEGTKAPEQTEPAPVTQPPETPAAPGLNCTVQSEERSLGTGSVARLKYPLLGNTGSETLETKVNGLLSRLAFDDFSQSDACSGYQDKIRTGATVSYTVTDCTVTLCNPYLLSFRTEGEFSSSDSAEKIRLIFTHLINLSTGTEIKTKAVFSDFGKVLDLLGAGKMQRIFATENFDSGVALDSMIEQYRARIKYGALPQIYFTPENLVVIVESEQKLGGWAEYAVSLGTVRAWLLIAP